MAGGGRPRLAAVAALALTATAVAGCGSDPERPDLTVFAAASLAPAFERYAEEFDRADVRFSFAGSDELAAQIRQGLTPDVYVAANTELPETLAAEGLLDRPTAVAANELVLAVPAGSDLEAVSDLGRPGLALGIGAEGVPIGVYTRELLAGLGPGRADAILGQVATSEPDVSGIVAKLNQGAIDAGFVYASDVAASGGELRAIRLPARLQPKVAYGAGVTAGARRPADADAFVAGLLEGEGAEALRGAGLSPPPRPTGGRG